MAQRGPKPSPRPVALQLLQGGRAAQAVPDAEIPQPSAPTEMPEPPAFLKGYAADEWRRVMPDLYSTGVYANIDLSMLAAYCMWYARWRVAEEDLAKMAALDPGTHGMMIKTTNGNLIQNPLVGSVTTAMKNMERLAVEFGLTPSSRTRISAKGASNTDPIAAKYGLDG